MNKPDRHFLEKLCGNIMQKFYTIKECYLRRLKIFDIFFYLINKYKIQVERGF